MHCRKGQCIFPLDVTTIGKSGMYFAINKERSDIKTELDYAMHQLDQDSPFFKADLYKKYFTLDYNQSLTGGEKSWLEEYSVCGQNNGNAGWNI